MTSNPLQESGPVPTRQTRKTRVHRPAYSFYLVSELRQDKPERQEFTDPLTAFNWPQNSDKTNQKDKSSQTRLQLLIGLRTPTRQTRKTRVHRPAYSFYLVSELRQDKPERQEFTDPLTAFNWSLNSDKTNQKDKSSQTRLQF